MDRKAPQQGVPARESWWSVHEQVPLAIALALAWLGIVFWWVLHGGCSGRTIDFDRATPLVAEFRVDLNAADWPEFAQLPGLGETLARRIVDYRAVHGPFRSVEDLRNVPGIGKKTLERIAPFLVSYPDEAIRPDQSVHSDQAVRPDQSRRSDRIIRRDGAIPSHSHPASPDLGTQDAAGTRP